MASLCSRVVFFSETYLEDEWLLLQMLHTPKQSAATPKSPSSRTTNGPIMQVTTPFTLTDLESMASHPLSGATASSFKSNSYQTKVSYIDHVTDIWSILAQCNCCKSFITQKGTKMIRDSKSDIPGPPGPLKVPPKPAPMLLIRHFSARAFRYDKKLCILKILYCFTSLHYDLNKSNNWEETRSVFLEDDQEFTCRPWPFCWSSVASWRHDKARHYHFIVLNS